MRVCYTAVFIATLLAGLCWSSTLCQVSSLTLPATKPYRAQLGFETKFLNFAMQASLPEQSRSELNVTVVGLSKLPVDADTIITVLGDEVFVITPPIPMRGRLLLSLGGMHISISADTEYWDSEPLPITVDSGYIIRPVNAQGSAVLGNGSVINIQIYNGVWALKDAGDNKTTVRVYVDSLNGVDNPVNQC